MLHFISSECSRPHSIFRIHIHDSYITHTSSHDLSFTTYSHEYVISRLFIGLPVIYVSDAPTQTNLGQRGVSRENLTSAIAPLPYIRKNKDRASLCFYEILPPGQSLTERDDRALRTGAPQLLDRDTSLFLSVALGAQSPHGSFQLI